jgi:hypothetical protein
MAQMASILASMHLSGSREATLAELGGRFGFRSGGLAQSLAASVAIVDGNSVSYRE